MTLYRGAESVPADFAPSAVTIGKFDGVHVGHRALIARLTAEAAERGLQPVAITFDRNPLALIAPERCPPELVSSAQRAELLADAGIASVVEFRFDRAFSSQSPEEFAAHVLRDVTRARLVLVGEDFRFGSRGAGTAQTLVELGPELGFDTIVLDDVPARGDRRASSSLVRRLLDEGDVAEAAEVLARPPRVRGEVVHGEARGRELGYPTANLAQAHEGYLPRDGVYAAWVRLAGDQHRYGAAVSIGDNPTFAGVPDRRLEAHLLDEHLDLYGREMEVEFVDYVRPMVKFAGADELVEQMRHDETAIRATLGYPATAGTARLPA